MSSKQMDIQTRPEVVGEQEGAPERELKARLVTIFRGRKDVRAAYLARVTYGGRLATVSVALCLRVESEAEVSLVKEIGRVFGGMFSSREHLDIVFVDDGLEAELKTKCSPFFSAREL